MVQVGESLSVGDGAEGMYANSNGVWLLDGCGLSVPLKLANSSEPLQHWALSS